MNLAGKVKDKVCRGGEEEGGGGGGQCSEEEDESRGHFFPGRSATTNREIPGISSGASRDLLSLRRRESEIFLQQSVAKSVFCFAGSPSIEKERGKVGGGIWDRGGSVNKNFMEEQPWTEVEGAMHSFLYSVKHKCAKIQTL